MRLSDNQFIEIWDKSANVKEVLVRTGLVYNSVISRAHRLRKKGYPIKMFPKQTKRGATPKTGIMIWLKERYPEIYEEWKNWENEMLTNE